MTRNEVAQYFIEHKRDIEKKKKTALMLLIIPILLVAAVIVVASILGSAAKEKEAVPFKSTLGVKGAYSSVEVVSLAYLGELQNEENGKVVESKSKHFFEFTDTEGNNGILQLSNDEYADDRVQTLIKAYENDTKAEPITFYGNTAYYPQKVATGIMLYVSSESYGKCNLDASLTPEKDVGYIPIIIMMVYVVIILLIVFAVRYVKISKRYKRIPTVLHRI